MKYNKTHGHWLPESWRFTVSPTEKTLYCDQMHVKQITVNPPITGADFELEVKPGMLVEERMALPTNSPLEWPKEKISVYRVKEKGEQEEIPDPFRRDGDQYQQHHSRQLVWIWVVFFVVACSLCLIWTRYRKSPKR